MKRWLAFLCLIGWLIAQNAIGLSVSAASDTPLFGDADGDGAVSMKDALLVRRFIAHQGTLVSPLAADVNADSSTDMRDVLLIRQYVAHLIDDFPPAATSLPMPDLSSGQVRFRYGYRQLSNLEKAAYDEAVAAVEATLGEDHTARDGVLGLTVDFTAELPNEAAAKHVFGALYADHPEFYFLCSDFSYSRTPRGTVKALLFHYFLTASQRAQAEPVLLQTVNAWVTGLPKGASDADKEIALHDRLCANCTYPKGDTYTDTYYSPYGALIQGVAVCDGYARALQLLCLAAGIDATVVEGFSKSDAKHMWNVVYLDGEPYYVDPTWDDTDLFVSHVYCNLTTAEIAPSHTMNFQFPTPPACTAKKYNYYRYADLYVTSSDGEAFAKLVLTARQNGMTSVEVCFAPDVVRANWQLTESGHLCDLVNERAPAGTPPLSGYLYALFDSVNVISITF